MNNTINYYELLGVKKDASTDEIREAYKKLMKKWHPDLNKDENAASMSMKINEAKEILLDDEKRKDYDEYLDNKVEMNYNRYTQAKKQEQNNNQYAQYESNNVTKWQYLKDWLKYGNVSSVRKVIGTIFVLLESLLCLIIKYAIISVAFITFFISNFIQELYNYLIGIFGLLLLVIAVMMVSEGLSNFLVNHPSEFKAMVIIISIYISSYVLPIIGSLLLSQKVFNFLYNKIDINLFKLCVDYKN